MDRTVSDRPDHDESEAPGGSEPFVVIVATAPVPPGSRPLG